MNLATDQLAALSEAGVSVWLDDLSRERLVSGSLGDLVRGEHVVGVTTNPTISSRAITGGDAYDGQVADLAARGAGVGEALRALTAFDVRWACDVLREVHDATDGLDGRVSIEVDPRLAHDTAATIAEARALWWLVDRPNLFVKIPAIRQGIPAIAACLAEGISVNATLIFSPARYTEVVEAFLDGLGRAVRSGRDLARIHAVASFFVSRIDSEVDPRLDALGTSRAASLRGCAALAAARLVYARHERVLAGPRWPSLAARGARRPRPLWASLGVKDPAYPDTRYVTELVAPSVVMTVPEPTLHAVADHGEIVADSIHGGGDPSRIIEELRALGIDTDEVARALEVNAVAAFDASWAQLGAHVDGALHAALHPDTRS